MIPKWNPDKINESLAAFIVWGKENYYKGTPVMSDEDFDLYEDYLRRRDPTNPILQKVGTEIKGV